MIDKEKLKELCNRWWAEDTENEDKVIEEWLEQNLPEPVVVGLSDEQISSFTEKYLIHPLVAIHLKEWQKTQTFAQPSDEPRSYVKGLRDEIIELKSRQLPPNWDDAPKDAVLCQIVPLWQDKDGNDVTWSDSQLGFVYGVYKRPTPPTPKVEVGQVWRYDNRKYHIDSIGKVKTNNELWVDCVTYRSLDDGHFYTRTMSDFLAKFDRVE